MSRFRTEGHLISWAGLCPKNDESAGKRRSTRMKRGAPWLKTTLIQCSWAATRTKGTYLHAQFLRLRSRRGAKRAIGAVAASILTAAYHMLEDGTLYQDLGSNHFDNRAKGKQVLRLINRQQTLGFAVQITDLLGLEIIEEFDVPSDCHENTRVQHGRREDERNQKRPLLPTASSLPA